MKLRATGLLLGSLLMLSVVAPAFAVSADENTKAENETSSQTQSVVETAETAKSAEAEIVEEPVSNSPFYLGTEQLTSLEYELFFGINYITVESFLTAMSDECMVEQVGGTVTAEAASVAGVVDVTGGNGAVPAANVIEETLTFSARVGDCYVTANGRCLYVENNVQCVNGKVAVPVRVLAQVFNLDVAYDYATRRVMLTRQAGQGAFLTSGDSYYDEETLYWLSHIIYAESGNQSMLGKLAVGNVVMNRVKSPAFPNTIKGVLFQKNQFSPARSGSIYRTPNQGSVVAAKLVLEGTCALENVLFFNRAGMNTYAARNRTYVATIGAHAFYK